jgi:hypothetical protein
MRCTFCSLVHKNTTRHQSWIDYQTCRVCYFILDGFSWNSNYLKEYWGSNHD